MAAWQSAFAVQVNQCPAALVDYVCSVTTALQGGGIRLSPRRARLLSRTLLAAMVVEGFTAATLGSRGCVPYRRESTFATLPRSGLACPRLERVANESGVGRGSAPSPARLGSPPLPFRER